MFHFITFQKEHGIIRRLRPKYESSSLLSPLISVYFQNVSKL